MSTWWTRGGGGGGGGEWHDCKNVFRPHPTCQTTSGSLCCLANALQSVQSPALGWNFKKRLQDSLKECQIDCQSPTTASTAPNGCCARRPCTSVLLFLASECEWQAQHLTGYGCSKGCRLEALFSVRIIV